MNVILSCPFCGGEPRIGNHTDRAEIQCEGCGAGMPGQKTWKRTLKAWNRRVEPPEPDDPLDSFELATVFIKGRCVQCMTNARGSNNSLLLPCDGCPDEPLQRARVIVEEGCIEKFPFEEDGMMLPKNARILTVGIQNGFWRLWAVVDPVEKEKEKRYVIAVPTGGRVPKNAKYVNTMTVSYMFVWHIFELDPEETSQEMMRNFINE